MHNLTGLSRRCWRILVAAGALLTLVLPSCSPSPRAEGNGHSGVALGTYTVLAWNDLGMHCLNNSFDTLMILPPFNTLWAQVIRRGNPPEIVSSGIRVEYRLENNTYSYGKAGYSSFWDVLAVPLATLLKIGIPAKNVGLAGKGLVGTLDIDSGRRAYVAVGIPATPLEDTGSRWNPYQVAVVTVKVPGTGQVLAETRATLPVSDEMDCAKCHASDATHTSFERILQDHDSLSGTSLLSRRPVICASCHSDPALGVSSSPQVSLSGAMHGWHAAQSPQPACLDCHPGQTTKCSRSTRHTAADGNCTACHGTLAQMAADLAPPTNRVPWGQEPVCTDCHAAGHSGGPIPEVGTGAVLYRNSSGHGGLACTACHGSPHAMVPTVQVSGYPNEDGYQSLQYQGYNGTVVKTIGSCGVCHGSSRGDPQIGEFVEAHGGRNPEQPNGCSACHTSIPSDTRRWPHAFQWNNSN